MARITKVDPQWIGGLMTDWLYTWFQEVEPKDFYRTIFPEGELERRGEYVRGKYSGIVVAVTGRKEWVGKHHKSKIKRYSLTDELDAVDVACDSDDFCICSPISYAGKTRTADHARMLYAIAVDVDRLRVDVEAERPLGLINLWQRHIEKVQRLPKPTFIVSSGSGLHLYYVLERPIPLFRDTVLDLQEFKRELTRLIWHDTIVDIDSPHDVQQEGIFQGFRMPGTVTKYGDRAIAFRTGDQVSVDYLNGFVRDAYKIRHFTYESKLRIAEAAEKYPDWYERRVIRREPRGSWAVNRAVYDWWLNQIRSGATVGHRYYCVMMLAIYARKCGQYDGKHNPNPVTRAELERDCFGLVDQLDALTDDDKNHFDNDDVLDALEAYDDRWVTFPRNSIEYRSGITIPANRRNGQKQAEHLEEARAIRDIRARRRGEAWDAHNGRKSKRDQVQEWRRDHPDGVVAECVRDTGISRATVYRHWEGASEIDSKRFSDDELEESST